MKGFFREIFSERFLMRRAERRASAHSSERRQKLRFLLAAARARTRAASGLRSPRESGPAFRLLAEAFALLATAHATACGEHDGEHTLGANEAHDRLSKLERPLELGTELEAFLRQSDPIAADRLSPREALALRPELESAIERLAAELEVRTVRRIRVVRVLRLMAVGLGLMIFFLATLAWALAPENVARGKPVRTSSVFPRTPDPAGATDGVRGRGFGVHTAFEHRPWVEIDLGRTRAISEVVVYHRSDNHQVESLPLTLELSDDGKQYLEMSTRTELFTATDPWRARCAGTRARWVRLIVSKKDKGYIALSEIEVYGR